MAGRPLRPATDRRLGGPLPHQPANQPSAAHRARGPEGSPALIRGCHAVLANLSAGCPPPRGTFRCLTHPSATRRQAGARAAVRLACVKHAASVQSEPGSNSSVRSLTSRSQILLTRIYILTFFYAGDLRFSCLRTGTQAPTPIICLFVKDLCRLHSALWLFRKRRIEIMTTYNLQVKTFTAFYKSSFKKQQIPIHPLISTINSTERSSRELYSSRWI